MAVLRARLHASPSRLQDRRVRRRQWNSPRSGLRIRRHAWPRPRAGLTPSGETIPRKGSSGGTWACRRSRSPPPGPPRPSRRGRRHRRSRDQAADRSLVPDHRGPATDPSPRPNRRHGDHVTRQPRSRVRIVSARKRRASLERHTNSEPRMRRKALGADPTGRAWTWRSGPHGGEQRRVLDSPCGRAPSMPRRSRGQPADRGALTGPGIAQPPPPGMRIGSYRLQGATPRQQGTTRSDHRVLGAGMRQVDLLRKAGRRRRGPRWAQRPQGPRGPRQARRRRRPRAPRWARRRRRPGRAGLTRRPRRVRRLRRMRRLGPARPVSAPGRPRCATSRSSRPAVAQPSRRARTRCRQPRFASRAADRTRPSPQGADPRSRRPPTLPRVGRRHRPITTHRPEFPMRAPAVTRSSLVGARGSVGRKLLAGCSRGGSSLGPQPQGRWGRTRGPEPRWQAPRPGAAQTHAPRDGLGPANLGVGGLPPARLPPRVAVTVYQSMGTTTRVLPARRATTRSGTAEARPEPGRPAPAAMQPRGARRPRPRTSRETPPRAIGTGGPNLRCRCRGRPGSRR
jgi:hypothetical protein